MVRRAAAAAVRCRRQPRGAVRLARASCTPGARACAGAQGRPARRRPRVPFGGLPAPSARLATPSISRTIFSAAWRRGSSSRCPRFAGTVIENETRPSLTQDFRNQPEVDDVALAGRVP